MCNVNGADRTDNPKTDVTNDKELNDKELDEVSAGVPGWWDYNDPSTHT